MRFKLIVQLTIRANIFGWLDGQILIIEKLKSVNVMLQSYDRMTLETMTYFCQIIVTSKNCLFNIFKKTHPVKRRSIVLTLNHIDYFVDKSGNC